MSPTLLTIVLGSLLLCLPPLIWRTMRGPQLADRLLGVSTAGIVFVLVLVLAGALDSQQPWFDSALAVALLSFATVVVVVKLALYGRVL